MLSMYLLEFFKYQNESFSKSQETFEFLKMTHQNEQPLTGHLPETLMLATLP